MQKEISPWEVVCLKAHFHGGGKSKALTRHSDQLLCAHTGCSGWGLLKAELQGHEGKVWGSQHRKSMDMLE